MGKRLRTQRRGRGGHVYRTPSHRFRAMISYPQVRTASGRVMELVHDPGHTAPLAEVRFETGHVAYMLAFDGMYIGQTITISAEAEAKNGNVLPLGNIPEGRQVFNIEILPGDGGKLVRAAGTAAIVVSQGKKTTVQMPSGALMSFPPRCKATLGIVAGGGRKDMPYAKAGKKHHSLRSRAKIWPYTGGVSMNPVNHPHGGGSHPHVGGPSTKSRNAWPGQKVGRMSPQKRDKEGGRI
ncbi:MAG: 50S ribosomal protein L2 [Thermoplasmata archaeon]|nr:50S ribosomal protein L2 [Thermoplasmata archaeon]